MTDRELHDFLASAVPSPPRKLDGAALAGRARARQAGRHRATAAAAALVLVLGVVAGFLVPRGGGQDSSLVTETPGGSLLMTGDALRDLDTGTVLPLVRAARPAYGPAGVLSDDGRTLVYNSASDPEPGFEPPPSTVRSVGPTQVPDGAAIRVLDRTTRQDRVLADGALSFAWRGDGPLAYVQRAESASVVRGSAGRVVVRPELDGADEVWLRDEGSYQVQAWAGARLLVHRDPPPLTADVPSDLLVVDGPGRVRVLSYGELLAVSPDGSRVLVINRGQPGTGLSVLDVASGATLSSLELAGTQPGAPGTWTGDRIIVPTLGVRYVTDPVKGIQEVPSGGQSLLLLGVGASSLRLEGEIVVPPTLASRIVDAEPRAADDLRIVAYGPAIDAGGGRGDDVLVTCGLTTGTCTGAPTGTRTGTAYSLGSVVGLVRNPSSTEAPPPATTGAAQAPPCASDDLLADVGSGVGGPPFSYDVVVENRSAVACSIAGDWSLDLRDEDGQVVPFVLPERQQVPDVTLPAFSQQQRVRAQLRVTDQCSLGRQRVATVRIDLLVGGGSVSTRGEPSRLVYCGPGDPASRLVVGDVELR